MDEELGYSKYDYRNKETDYSRNGHSQKTMHTSYGDMEIDIPRDRKQDSFFFCANFIFFISLFVFFFSDISHSRLMQGAVMII